MATSNGSLRVLLSDTWASGGGSTFVATMARELSRRGHVVDVILGYRTSEAVEAYRHHVRHVFEPPAAFGAIALTHEYDVVHMTEEDLSPPFAYARRLRRLGLGATTVVTSHTGEQGVSIASDADVLVFVSESARRNVRSTSRATAVIPNGVDAAALRAMADDSLVRDVAGPLVVWSGRVTETRPQKDFLGFGYALRTLLDHGWTPLVVDGSPPDPVAPTARQLERWFGAEVLYANQVPAGIMLGVLQHAGRTGGAFVSTSRVEAAPFVALEALALGCPVVAPAIDGYASLIASGVATPYEDLDGLLGIVTSRSHAGRATTLPPGLSASDMVEAYLRLYEQPTGQVVPPMAAPLRRAVTRGAADPRLAPLAAAARAARGRLRR